MRCSASAGIGAGRSSIVKSAVRAGPWRSLSVGGPQNRRLRPGAKGHTAASHWALRGSMARPECVAQPGAWRVHPRRPGLWAVAPPRGQWPLSTRGSTAGRVPRAPPARRATSTRAACAARRCASPHRAARCAAARAAAAAARGGAAAAAAARGWAAWCIRPRPRRRPRRVRGRRRERPNGPSLQPPATLHLAAAVQAPAAAAAAAVAQEGGRRWVARAAQPWAPAAADGGPGL